MMLRTLAANPLYPDHGNWWSHWWKSCKHCIFESLVGTAMNKHAVIEAVLAELMNQLELVRGASREAAEYATHEESRADSKWDTQGLEASYLAAGQGAQVLAV